MTNQTFDAAGFKGGQRRDWSTAAPGWERWWRTLEKGLTPVTQRLLELAEIRAAQRVLDVATGIGEPSLSAAGIGGASSHVTATDIAPGMLDIASKRAQEAGATNIEFSERDAEALDFPPGTFDAVLCRFGLMFLPNLADSLQRMRTALKEGGRVAAAVWGPPERVPGMSATLGGRRRTADTRLGPTVPSSCSLTFRLSRT